MSYKDFANDNRKGILRDVLFFYGAEDFLMEWAVSQIIEQHVDDAWRSIDVRYLDGDSTGAHEIMGEARAYSMFSDKRVIVIRNYLPLELKEKFSDDELYYFLDVIIDYYTSGDVLNAEPDKDGYVEIDLDKVADVVIAKAKKEKIGEYEHDDILLVVQAEMEYSEQFEDDEE